MMSGKMYRFRVPEPYIEARFVEAYLQTAVAKQAIDRMKTGGSDSGLNLTHERFRRLEIPIAPSNEQRRIVAAIEEQFSRLDAGTAALERVHQNIIRMRAALLMAAVTGRLTSHCSNGDVDRLLESINIERRSIWMEASRGPYKDSISAASFALTIPDHWRIASLETLTNPVRMICYGILMPKVREGGTVPYVEVKDLRANRLSMAPLHRTSIELHRAFPRSVLASGDVVLAIRGSYDRALVVPDEVAGANVSRDVARIAPLPGLLADYLAAYLMSPPALRYLRERARGVAVKGVNIADIRRMPVPLPPLTEQLQIIAELERIDTELDRLDETLTAERRRGKALRSSILTAAFSGRLALQDPNDEPASTLLDRVTVERTVLNDRKRATT
jgi:type I restriction enzyme S subunit